jgi:ABC-2 type transport system permease protein
MLGDLSDPALLVDAGAVISTSELSDTQVMIANNDFAVALLSINWPLLISLFIFFFIGGFLLYGAMFAAIGSAVDAETDTQQFMLPVSLPLIFGFIVAEMLVQNPDSSLGVIFELVPFTSPIVMMIRSAMGFSGIEWLVLFSSMAILILTFLLFVWIAGRIYRIGILMYGKKASYKEIWKWIIAKQ